MCCGRATLIRDVPYTMLELGLYENFKTLLKKYHKREDLSNMVRPRSSFFTTTSERHVTASPQTGR